MSQARFYVNDKNAPVPNCPNHIGVAVLIIWQDKLLCEYRTDSDLWSFIGGGLEIDETLAQCAIREVKEETGIVLTAKDLVYCHTYDDPARIIAYPGGDVLRSISVVYQARLLSPPALVVSSESRSLAFFSPDEIRTLPFAATHVALLEDFVSGKYAFLK